MDLVEEGEPVCLLGLTVHILVAGATFNLHTRQASAGRAGATQQGIGNHAHPRSFGLRRALAVRALPGHPARARPRRAGSTGRRRSWAPAFVDGLVAALPGLGEHGCSYREPGGFIRRMREDEGTWLGHVLEHVAIELQNVAGEDVTFGKTRSVRRPPGRLHGGLRIRAAGRRHRGRRTGDAAAVLAAAGGTAPAGSVPEGWDWADGARRVHPLRAAPRARPVHRSLVHAAEERDIPWLRLNAAVADPAGPRQVPAAHPGHGHRPHHAHRGGAGQRQGRDQQDPGHAGPAGAAPGAGADRGSGRARRAHASATRWSPSPTTATTAAASRSA